MRTAFDATDVLTLPAGADLYMGYDDGNWPNAAAIAAKFPGKTVVRITVFPADNEGDMLDVENGDATPAEAPAWVAQRRAAGHGGPLVYCAESNRVNVVGAFAVAKVALPGLFIAAYPGVGAALQEATDVGHQYSDQGGGGAYDISVVVDYLPGIDSWSPGPLSTQTEKNMLTKNTSAVNGGGYWGARANASVYTFDGAEYIGPHVTWAAKWGIGTVANPVVGIAADGAGGFALLTDNGGPQPEIYNIPANGQYKNPV